MVLMPLPHSPQGFLFLLPAELLDEFARQPDKVVSLHAYTREVMHPKYTTFGENFVDNSIHYPVVYRELGQKLASQTDKINDETAFAIKDTLTSQIDKNGNLSINMWETSLKLLTQISNRAVIGLPLCRNQEFLDANRRYSDNMFSVGLLIRLIPGFLRPYVSIQLEKLLYSNQRRVGLIIFAQVTRPCRTVAPYKGSEYRRETRTPGHRRTDGVS